MNITEEFRLPDAAVRAIDSMRTDDLLDSDKIQIFRAWLSDQKGLRTSRRVATYDHYHFDRTTGARYDLCARSARRMSKLTRGVVPGWGGQWQVRQPLPGVMFDPSRTWQVLCIRHDPDDPDDPTSFNLIRLDHQHRLMPMRPSMRGEGGARIIPFRLPKKTGSRAEHFGV